MTKKEKWFDEIERLAVAKYGYTTKEAKEYIGSLREDDLDGYQDGYSPDDMLTEEARAGQGG